MYINGWKLGQINNSVVFSLLMIAMSFYNTDWMEEWFFQWKSLQLAPDTTQSDSLWYKK